MGTYSKEYVIKAFGKNLYKTRKEKQISQEKLAALTGLECSQIGRIERGIINTSIHNVFIIAKALEIPPSDLFDFDFEETP